MKSMSSHFLYGDFNNDGMIEFWLDDVSGKGGNESHQIYKGNFPAQIPNTAPEKPAAPTCLYEMRQVISSAYPGRQAKTENHLFAT